jgi:hypothetical protein
VREDVEDRLDGGPAVAPSAGEGRDLEDEPGQCHAGDVVAGHTGVIGDGRAQDERPGEVFSAS